MNDLVENIVREQTDNLGVCEIGTSADVQDLQSRLSAYGLDLPYTHIVGGADAYRRQAILSRFPLQAHESANQHFQFNGQRHLILRGILDVTIQLPTGDVRFLGAHLKSKRPSKYYDQELIRRNEAHLIRKHADRVLKSSPRLIIYGDLNDTRESPSVRAIAGDFGSDNYLHALNLSDSNGHKWTHYWKDQDVYSRFDYIFVSSDLKAGINRDETYLQDITSNNLASDHRALVLSFH